MIKDLTFHINNKAYTISGDEELEKELGEPGPGEEERPHARGAIGALRGAGGARTRDQAIMSRLL